MLEPLRVLISPPADYRRQWLRPVVIIERGQLPPAIVAARQLHHAGHDHELKEQQLEQENRRSRNRDVAAAIRPELPRREKDRQETRFEQQAVPVETEERLSRNRERQIKRKKHDQRGHRRTA